MSLQRKVSIPNPTLRRRALVLLVLLFSVATNAWGATPIRVAVAANFKPTLEHINREFMADTGYEVSLSAGSTGVLFNQIMHGAPFDVFFAADADSAIKLKASSRGAGLDAPFCYARGRLVLTGGDGQLAQLSDASLSLAIANPATAPYGVAAMQVLGREQFSMGKSRKLVRGANALQAYQFWHSGSVALALLPRALVPEATPIPESWHQPLDQFALVLIPVTGNPALASYLNWIRSDRVRTLITTAGYESCH